MKQDEVRRTLDRHRQELISRFGVRSLALFGSVVRNEANEDSDIDMLVEFNRPTGYFGLVALQEYLDAGTTEVIVITPKMKMVKIFRHGHTATVLRSGDILRDLDSVPGFQCHVDEIFA